MTKQTIGGRVARLARADIDALLGRAADPQKTADQLVREYRAHIREAQDAVEAAIGNLRRLEHDHAEDVAAAAVWGGKAAATSRKADELRRAGSTVEADRFDLLAKVALGRQLRSEQEARGVEPVIAAQAGVADELRDGLTAMKDRLGRLQDRREELVARSRTGPARGPVLDGVESVDVLDPTGDLGRFEQKVRREEARSEGREELAASTLDRQFESLDEPGDTGDTGDTAEVESRLARLKETAAA